MVAQRCCLCSCLWLTSIFIGLQCVFFGAYAFNNPDLTGEERCWVEPKSFTPVAIGNEHSGKAVDATKAIINVFQWEFALNISALACIMLIFSFMFGCMKLPEDFLDKFENGNEFNSDVNQISCLVWALLLIWVVGTIGLAIIMYMVRYRHESRVCSGDYLKSEALKSFPYMQKSGKFLYHYTLMKWHR